MDPLDIAGIVVILCVAAVGVFAVKGALRRRGIEAVRQDFEQPEEPVKAEARRKLEEAAARRAAWAEWDAEVERMRDMLKTQPPPADAFKVEQDEVTGLWRVWRRTVRLPWRYTSHTMRHYDDPPAGVPTVRWCWELVDAKFPSFDTARAFVKGAATPDKITHHFNSDGESIPAPPKPQTADEDEDD